MNPIAECKCGQSYDHGLWLALAYVGDQVVEPDKDGSGYVLELRNCTCGSTLAVDKAEIVAEECLDAIVHLRDRCWAVGDRARVALWRARELLSMGARRA